MAPRFWETPKCDECGRSCSSIKEWNNHVKESHPQIWKEMEREEKGLKSSRRNRKCHMCAASIKNLTRHLIQVHQLERVEALRVSNEASREEGYGRVGGTGVDCPIEKCSSKVMNLSRHLQTVHKKNASVTRAIIKFSKYGQNIPPDLLGQDGANAAEWTNTVDRAIVTEGANAADGAIAVDGAIAAEGANVDEGANEYNGSDALITTSGSRTGSWNSGSSRRCTFTSGQVDVIMEIFSHQIEHKIRPRLQEIRSARDKSHKFQMELCYKSDL